MFKSRNYLQHLDVIYNIAVWAYVHGNFSAVSWPLIGWSRVCSAFDPESQKGLSESHFAQTESGKQRQLKQTQAISSDSPQGLLHKQ
ncbi:uncharacterized protein ASCRUDRAFT_147558 [Ascoidea rubescens DSM 1968]|uniref:Uncharacterized protein n=1 Tax=Ascoidea rubescens DSM 1968 TaxID=1344418 RepID=A0A1D2VHS5_9ASCO|nr:hypothetical protein ASCRUDRAFT_147558 [Ascoidea rubescens DSM 1968]ODV61206.1 hypothetical protein ASCRUDRAFT_147558 [Ascoidea rubescens DSM 1968]